MKAGKIWGQTELIHANGVLEFHRIEFKSGIQCSKHQHKFKWNGFYVESGKMLVRVWQQGKQDGLVDETILKAGDFTRVKPGLLHQFEGIEDGVLLNYIGQNLITMILKEKHKVKKYDKSFYRL